MDKFYDKCNLKKEMSINYISQYVNGKAMLSCEASAGDSALKGARWWL